MALKPRIDLSIVVVRLMGGIGNQLFQVALGAHVALHSGTGLVLDGRSLEGTHDGIGVLAYRMNVPQLFPQRGGGRPDGRLERTLISAVSKYVWSARISISRRRTTVLTDTAAALDYLMDRHRRTVVIEGFYQDLPIDIINESVSSGCPELRDPTRWYAERLEEVCALRPIGVHVRRGDFTLNPAWGVLSAEYYVRALTAMAPAEGPLWIFTDDREGASDVASALAEWNPTFVIAPADSPAGESLLLLSQCSTVIGSNSTFAYWATAYSSARACLPSYFRPSSHSVGEDVTRIPGVTTLAPTWRTA
jgi:hypothetical protein